MTDDVSATAVEDVPEFATVEVGDDLAAFCGRYGVNEDDVLRLNAHDLEDHAAARGFPPTYERLVPDEDPRKPAQRVVEFRVFAGERLRLRPEG